jgi:hypothetical protein
MNDSKENRKAQPHVTTSQQEDAMSVLRMQIYRLRCVDSNLTTPPQQAPVHHPATANPSTDVVHFKQSFAFRTDL